MMLLEKIQSTVIEESIEKHETLNPELFDEDTLKPEVEDKIEDIAFKFKTNLENDGVKLDIKDIYLVGSNASYNYTKDSDIDIHIIANEAFDCDEHYLPIIYNAYKSLFNDKYDFKLNGYDTEIYVEDESKLSNVSNGVYSILKDEWIKVPDKDSIPNFEEHREDFEKEFTKWENKYFDFMSRFEHPLDEDFNHRKEVTNPIIDEVDAFIDDLYIMRQRSIQQEGEYGTGNLVFKEFRNLGYLDTLKKLKIKEEEKELSL